MSDITVSFGGQKFFVSGEGAGATVRQIVRHGVTNVDGFRTVKHGSPLWRDAVKHAAYQRALKEGRRP